MSKLAWDLPGERLWETGVSNGVLYKPTNGVYGPGSGTAWNGLTTVTESPSGAESTKAYADNIPYANMVSIEEFAGTIEAYMFPDEFAECDGNVVPTEGLYIGQQTRKPFGLAYKTLIGNDTDDKDHGYKLHLVYNATCSPSEKAYATVNDSPEAITLSWGFTTIPVAITTAVNGKVPKPTSILTIDSTKVDATALSALEDALFGTSGADARLPSPDEVIALFMGTVTQVTPTVPTFVSTTGVVTIPTVTGVQYRRASNNAVVTGTYTIPGGAGASEIIYAIPTGAHVFAPGVDDDWQFTRTA